MLDPAGMNCVASTKAPGNFGIGRTHQMDPRWLAKYRPMSELFMDYGWFVSPFLIGAELEIVEKTADFVVKNPPKSEEDRREIESKIYKCLLEPVFHPGYRARATWYGNQLFHFREFNHLYEAAIFSYYKRDYAQSILCLLSALEGIMLSFYGYSIDCSSNKPSIAELIGKIKSSTSDLEQPLDAAHDMYRDTLVSFLEKWIYKNTKHSDFSLSVLNRHYVLHGMDAGNFYRPQDLHRMILAFDLIIEFLSFQQELFYAFAPDEGTDEFCDKRRNYYEALAFGRPTIRQSWQVERELLRQHVRYVEPSHDPNMQESVATFEAMMADVIEMIARTRS
jgi:hypothetical protein